MRLFKLVVVLLFFNYAGCKKDIPVCVNKELKNTPGHLIDMSVINGDKRMMDSLQLHPNLQIVYAKEDANHLYFNARQVYQNLPVFNCTYILTKIKVSSTYSYYELYSNLAQQINVNIKPSISASIAKIAAENVNPNLGCYSYQLGIYELLPIDLAIPNEYHLVYYFKWNNSEAYAVIDAHTGAVITSWNGMWT